MPTYDYVCRACKHRFEHFQSMQEASLRKCPECGRMRLERLIGSGAGILFKGTGFYETDYKRKSGGPAGSDGPGKPGKPSSDSGGTSEAKSGAKSDSKPDAKGGGGDGPPQPPAKGKKPT